MMKHNNKTKPNLIEKKKRLKLKARRELNEFEEEVPKCLSELRKHLKEEESLYCPLDDKFLLRFLRARKFDISMTLSLIKQYYIMRSRNVELFENLCPDSLSHVLATNIQAVLEERDAAGREVFLFRAGKWNPDLVNLDDIFRTNYLFLEEMTASEETQICGVTAIVDFDGMGFYQARQFTPKHASRMIQLIQKCCPGRFQEFHMINQPYVFDLLYAIVKPFLSEKIRKRIYFHGRDLASLHKRVNPQILPDFLGGSVSLNERMKNFNQNLMRKNQYYKGNKNKKCAVLGLKVPRTNMFLRFIRKMDQWNCRHILRQYDNRKKGRHNFFNSPNIFQLYNDMPECQGIQPVLVSDVR